MEEVLYTDPDGDQIRLFTDESLTYHHHLAIKNIEGRFMFICLPEDKVELTQLAVKIMGKLVGPGTWLPAPITQESAE